MSAGTCYFSRKLIRGRYVCHCLALATGAAEKGGGGGAMTLRRAVHGARFRAVRESVQREQPVGKSYHLHAGDDSVSG